MADISNQLLQLPLSPFRQPIPSAFPKVPICIVLKCRHHKGSRCTENQNFQPPYPLFVSVVNDVLSMHCPKRLFDSIICRRFENTPHRTSLLFLELTISRSWLFIVKRYTEFQRRLFLCIMTWCGQRHRSTVHTSTTCSLVKPRRCLAGIGL